MNNTNKKGDTFPTKLFKILSDTDSSDYHPNQEAISWLPDGKSFRIHSERQFSDLVMAEYFTQTKFASFTRQLYLYGFLKTVSGPDYGEFHHPRFMRSDQKGSMSIKRNQVTCDRRRGCKVTRSSGHLLETKWKSREGTAVSLGSSIVGGAKGDVESSTEDCSRVWSAISATRHAAFQHRPVAIKDPARPKRNLPSFLIPRQSSSTLGSCHQGLMDMLDDALSTVEDHADEEYVNLSKNMMIPHVVEDRTDESLHGSDQEFELTNIINLLSKEDEDDSEVMHGSPTLDDRPRVVEEQSPRVSHQYGLLCTEEDLRMDDVLLKPRSIEEMIRYPL